MNAGDLAYRGRKGIISRGRAFLVLMLVAPFLVLACGDDDGSPTETPTPTDAITVTLNYIDVIENCDPPTGEGRVQYKFYVTTTLDGQDTTYLDTDWKTIDSADGTLWDNLGRTTTFQLPRRDGAEFKVRISLRELDATEDFSEGRFVTHDPTRSPEELWQPDFGGYSSYFAAQNTGTVLWRVEPRSDCRIQMEYQVEVRPI